MEENVEEKIRSITEQANQTRKMLFLSIWDILSLWRRL